MSPEASVTTSKPVPTKQDHRIATIITGAIVALVLAFVAYALLSESRTERCDRLVSEWASLVVDQREYVADHGSRSPELTKAIDERLDAGVSCGRNGLIEYGRTGK